MKSQENNINWIIAQLIVGFLLLCLTGWMLCAEKISAYTGLVGAIGVVTLSVCLKNMLSIRKQTARLNEVTELFNANPSFRFSKTSDFIDHVRYMIVTLGDLPFERLSLINSVGLIVEKSRLEALILYFIDERPDVLDETDLGRLQLHLVGRFPEKSEKMFEGRSNFQKNSDESLAYYVGQIKRYFKITGTHANEADLAGGVFRSLATQGLSSGSLAIFAHKLDCALIAIKDFDRERSAEILRMVLALNYEIPK